MSKLLLVEDDQSIVSSLSDYLGNEGFKIENAPGQKEAIEKLDSDQYDIALVDIQLSNGNGFSVCSAIKERGTMPDSSSPRATAATAEYTLSRIEAKRLHIDLC